MFEFNGVSPQRVIFNGVEVEKVVHNGVVVWENWKELDSVDLNFTTTYSTWKTFASFPIFSQDTPIRIQLEGTIEQNLRPHWNIGTELHVRVGSVIPIPLVGGDFCTLAGQSLSLASTNGYLVDLNRSPYLGELKLSRQFVLPANRSVNLVISAYNRTFKMSNTKLKYKKI